jgi:diguanylate cyclase (GGDEF)-like protein
MRRFSLLVSSVVAVVTLGGVAVWTQVSAADEVDRVHRDDRATLQSTLAGLTQQYMKFTFLATSTAASADDWQLAPGSAADFAHLRTVVRTSPLTSYGAAVVSLTGSPLTSYPSASALPRPDAPGLTRLRRDLLAGQPGLSDVMSVNGTAVVAFAVPINRSGHPVGLLVTFADLHSWPLQGYDSQLQIGPKARAYVLDPAGVIAAASAPTLIGQRLPGLPARALAAGAGIATAHSAEGNVVVSYGPAGQGWIAATVQPTAQFSGVLHRSRNLELLALALLLSLAVLLLIVFHHKRQQVLARLADERLMDPLTGLGQRGVFEMRLRAALARRRRHGRPLAVMFCDIDHFKSVNDQHGHNAGDQLLVTVSKRLSEAVRETDMVARLGGDEFAVIVEETSAEETRGIAERMRALAAMNVELHGRPYTPQLSIGVALMSGEECTLDELLHEADMAMYQAKRDGLGCVLVEARMPTPGPLVPEPRHEMRQATRVD